MFENVFNSKLNKETLTIKKLIFCYNVITIYNISLNLIDNNCQHCNKLYCIKSFNTLEYLIFRISSKKKNK